MAFKPLNTLAVFVILMTIWGCASEPVALNLPANHPADPNAAETAYTVVPNPFKNNGSMDKMMNSDGPASMPHLMDATDDANKMKPMHDKNLKDPEKSDNLHQEHN